MKRSIRIVLSLMMAVPLFACDDDDGVGTTADSGLGEPMNADMPAYGCMTGGATDTEGCDTDDSAAGSSTTAGASTTSAVEDQCASSEECDGGSCTAPVEAPPDGDERPTLSRGAFACVFVCIADLDDSQWCSDDASCCSPQARCTDRGYCVIE